MFIYITPSNKPIPCTAKAATQAIKHCQATTPMAHLPPNSLLIEEIAATHGVYKRLKTSESSHLTLGWNLNREIAKLNYRIHTDAIKDNLIPPELTPAQIAYTYADEADLLNVALF